MELSKQFCCGTFATTCFAFTSTIYFITESNNYAVQINDLKPRLDNSSAELEKINTAFLPLQTRYNNIQKEYLDATCVENEYDTYAYDLSNLCSKLNNTANSPTNNLRNYLQMSLYLKPDSVQITYQEYNDPIDCKKVLIKTCDYLSKNDCQKTYKMICDQYIHNVKQNTTDRSGVFLGGQGVNVALNCNSSFQGIKINTNCETNIGAWERDDIENEHRTIKNYCSVNIAVNKIKSDYISKYDLPEIKDDYDLNRVAKEILSLTKEQCFNLLNSLQSKLDFTNNNMYIKTTFNQTKVEYDKIQPNWQIISDIHNQYKNSYDLASKGNANLNLWWNFTIFLYVLSYVLIGCIKCQPVESNYEHNATRVENQDEEEIELNSESIPIATVVTNNKRPKITNNRC